MPIKEEKVQGTLDSFFGLKGGAKKQTTLKGFVTSSKDKENTKNETETGVSKEMTKRRQHAILDDDSSDEEMEKKAAASPAKKAKIEKEETKTRAKVTATTKETKEPALSAATAKTEVPKTRSIPEAEKEVPKTDDTKTESNLFEIARRLAKAAKVETDVEEIPSPVPYSELAKAFEEIEATTKRLEIQSILTKLLRRVLLHCPEDLHSVVYLASNSIAPAYDCVELGIGDSILEGAVGQAYGTAAST